jgi:3-oxoacyl-[acyl-carrier-protein] synthase II
VTDRPSDRLLVTGVGLVTPLGPNVEVTWKRLVAGDRAIEPLRLFDPAGQRASFAAEAHDVELHAGLAGRPRDVAAAWSRSSAMAASAAGEAMQMAGLGRGTPGPKRVGLVVGGTTGGMFETERLLAKLHAEAAGAGARDALADMLSHPLTATGDRLGDRLGPFARVRTLSSACSSGANALVVAAGWLLSGEVDAVVAGGTDALCRLTITGFNAIAAIDPEPCRPFDRRRRGTTLGEGAGFVVLERAFDARARGAAGIAELAGWAIGAESHHITNPAPDGAVVAALIERALARAGLSPSAVDYVNAHGTGTVANDRMEAVALARALGAEIERVPVSSSKGQIGHTLGAAGAIEAVVTALAVARRTVVPTGGLEEPDAALGLVHVLGRGHEVPRMRAALSNAFGFGGMDTVLVFADPDRDGAAARLAGKPGATPARRDVVVTGASVFGPCGRVGADGCAGLPEGRYDLASKVDPDVFLDLARARRLDRSASLGAVAVEHVLDESKAPRDTVGVVLGSAFGNVDGCAAFMHRIFQKGPRAASPAEFPNLVPSAAVGHVSIYSGLHGPAFGVADLATSGESAVVQACQLVASGEAARVVGGSAEPRGDIAERVLSGLFDGADAPARATTVHADLAAAVLFEAADAARERGGRVLARVVQALEWRGDRRAALTALRAPRSAIAAGSSIASSRAEVVLARIAPTTEALLDETAWRGCPRVACAPALGESDALGAVALAVAAARIASGLIGEALVLGMAQGRGYAVVLEAA